MESLLILEYVFIWFDFSMGSFLGRKCQVKLDLSIKDEPLSPQLE
jgi:hypothetical protein